MPEQFSLVVTGWAVLANGALFLALTVIVIRQRRSDAIVLGDGGKRDMAKRIRGQANAAEQMPIFLIALGASEALGASCWLLAAIAALFTAGRLAHAVYFARPGTHWRFRFWGMSATLAAQSALLLTLAARLIG